MGKGELGHDDLVGRIAGALKLGTADAEERVSELSAAGLLEVSDDDRATVAATNAGAQLHTQVRGAVGEITARLWGDLPEHDLDAAGRVLATVLERANAELARV
jgi:DNA-binding MarR family transcriptional regulator